MQPETPARAHCAGFAAALTCGLLAAVSPAVAAGCSFAPQGEGRVAAVIDARTFRLHDGREVRLAGIEPAPGEETDRGSALSALIAGRDVSLRGDDDSPDRYGRQPAFVYLDGSDTPVQSLLLVRGEALVSATIADQGCAGILECRGGRGAAGPARNLVRSSGHKKRGKSGRYFGRDRAVYRGRGKGSVGPAGRGNDLPEFRTELDTGLRRDYFKAHGQSI